MIAIMDAASVYVIEAETDVPYGALEEFYSGGGHDDDVAKIVFADGRVWYANRGDVLRRMVGDDCHVGIEGNFFVTAYGNRHLRGGSLPVLDMDGNPTYLVQWQRTYYNHSYWCDPSDIDLAVFDLYDAIALNGLNEYSYLILAECVPQYRGDAILVGESWTELLKLYPAEGLGSRTGQVRFARSAGELADMAYGKSVMQIGELGLYGMDSRRLNHCFYDAVMPLLYYFADSRGQKPATPPQSDRRRFVIIDARFVARAGFVAMYEMLWDMYCYAASEGYIPIMKVVSSPEVIYSDADGEDIWGKFFIQPSGYTFNDVRWGEDEVRFAPNARLTLNTISLAGKIAPHAPLNMSSLLNKKCLDYIAEERERVFGDKKRILGLLVRGTDYTASRPAGHQVQATVEQVVAKAEELGADGFSYIYVATEDADVLECLKQKYGDRLLYTGQRRYRVKPGQWLGDADVARDAAQGMEALGDGWRRGVEYLASLQLLSECDGIVASGKCGATRYVECARSRKYNPYYIFELGIY